MCLTSNQGQLKRYTDRQSGRQTNKNAKQTNTNENITSIGESFKIFIQTYFEMTLHYTYGDLVNGGFDPGFPQSNRILQILSLHLSGSLFELSLQ